MIVFTRKKLWWKQYNLRCQYCGTDKYVSEKFLKLRLILNGEVRHQCKKCGKESRYILVNHIAHAMDKIEKDTNKQIKVRQEEIRG